MENIHNSPTLKIDLAALARNYALLKSKAGGKCSAVVKANAYGLGVREAALALYDVGCREFFVATLEEGVELRNTLVTGHGSQAAIYVFHGVRKNQAKDFIAHELIPVLNDRAQIEHWNNAGPAALHIDTGMCRLGVTPAEAETLAAHHWTLILSHLACANEAAHPGNAKQLTLFKKALAHFPGARASLANSSGIFLSNEHHFNLARPGCSLYGISPDTARPNPMEHVATLSAPVLQYRVIDHDQPVGYGGTATARKGSVLATVELGYADGFQRVLSNHAFGYAAGVKVPLIGRVSMDMVSIDVSSVPEHLRTPDLRIEFICRQQPVDMLAEAAGTIGYEIFTGLGRRIKRVYRHE